MSSYVPSVLSGSADGIGVQITATSTVLAHTIHTGPSDTSVLHEIYLYAQNSVATANVTLTVEYGQSGAVTTLVDQVPPGLGPRMIVPGFRFRGNAAPKILKVFANTADRVSVFGTVNIITL